eukprot:TRINITY_DN6746_c0_g1_i1.p1 TRINITY_DN6746_c0_g1~~TRINITY_DN6746_c0_g1_i1.p1  ORF type:complete len:390 (+),score=93.06 TRINITY_DN6746_c0_g1_i1:283-1452(+)
MQGQLVWKSLVDDCYFTEDQMTPVLWNYVPLYPLLNRPHQLIKSWWQVVKPKEPTDYNQQLLKVLPDWDQTKKRNVMQKVIQDFKICEDFSINWQHWGYIFKEIYETELYQTHFGEFKLFLKCLSPGNEKKLGHWMTAAQVIQVLKNIQPDVETMHISPEALVQLRKHIDSPMQLEAIWSVFLQSKNFTLEGIREAERYIGFEKPKRTKTDKKEFVKLKSENKKENKKEQKKENNTEKKSENLGKRKPVDLTIEGPIITNTKKIKSNLIEPEKITIVQQNTPLESHEQNPNKNYPNEISSEFPRKNDFWSKKKEILDQKNQVINTPTLEQVTNQSTMETDKILEQLRNSVRGFEQQMAGVCAVLDHLVDRVNQIEQHLAHIPRDPRQNT